MGERTDLVKVSQYLTIAKAEESWSKVLEDLQEAYRRAQESKDTRMCSLLAGPIYNLKKIAREDLDILKKSDMINRDLMDKLDEKDDIIEGQKKVISRVVRIVPDTVLGLDKIKRTSKGMSIEAVLEVLKYAPPAGLTVSEVSARLAKKGNPNRYATVLYNRKYCEKRGILRRPGSSPLRYYLVVRG
jgi:hypothetical protein